MGVKKKVVIVVRLDDGHGYDDGKCLAQSLYNGVLHKESLCANLVCWASITLYITITQREPVVYIRAGGWRG